MSTTIAESRYSTKEAGLLSDRPSDVPIGLTYFATDTNSFYVSLGSNKWASVATQSDGVSLSWTAGKRGKPGLNADIQAAAEATRMVTDADFEIEPLAGAGVNSTSALCTFNAEGGITITTAGADGDNEIIIPHLDANQSAWTKITWGTDKSVGWSCNIQSGANITNAIIWAGLKLTATPVTATDADQVFFRYEDDIIGGDWQAIYSVGGADTAQDTNVSVAVSTNYELMITIDADRIARMYINGTLVVTSTALTDTTDLIPYIGVEADGAGAAKAITVYGQTISRSAG